MEKYDLLERKLNEEGSADKVIEELSRLNSAITNQYNNKKNDEIEL